MLVVLLLFSITVFARYANTRPIEECIGQCVDAIECRPPLELITSNRCAKGGELQRGKVCCVSAEDITKEIQPRNETENETPQTPTTPQTTNCRASQFPIHSEGDPYRYVCLSDNQARPCNLETDTVQEPFDACDARDTHPVYVSCCLGEEITEPEQPQTYEPENINLKLGPGGANIPSILAQDIEYNFYLNTKGTSVEKCRAITYNNLGEIITSNLQINVEKEGNCEDEIITLKPTLTDINELAIPPGEQPRITLKIILELTDGPNREESFTFTLTPTST